MTPPPAMTSGRAAPRMTAAARAIAAGSATGRGTCQVRRREQFDRPVECLCLHVFGKADGHGPRLGGIGEHSHRSEEGTGQLLGTLHPVEPARHGPEGVVDRHIPAARVLELLEHRVRRAARKDVGRQQQHGEAVDGGKGGACDHVRRPRADRRRAGERREPVPHPGEADGDVHHGLLIAGRGSRGARPGRCSSASRSASPIPATLPWPKIPKQPSTSRCSTPSRSLCWRTRNRTTACATVSRVVTSSSSCSVPGSAVHGQAGVDLLVGPGGAHPGVGRDRRR